MIKKILTRDPDSRPTAKEILRDPWFVSLGMVQEEKRNFTLESVLSSRRRDSQDLTGSRRNYSTNRRENHHTEQLDHSKNMSVDLKQNTSSHKNMYNNEEPGKFCTKKTVIKNPSNEKSFAGQLLSNSHTHIQKIANQSYNDLKSSYHQRTYSRDRSAGKRGNEAIIHPNNTSNNTSYQQNNNYAPSYGTPRRGRKSPSLQLRSHSKGIAGNSNGFVDQQRAVSREKTQIKNPPLPSYHSSTVHSYNQTSVYY